MAASASRGKLIVAAASDRGNTVGLIQCGTSIELLSPPVVDPYLCNTHQHPSKEHLHQPSEEFVNKSKFVCFSTPVSTS